MTPEQARTLAATVKAKHRKRPEGDCEECVFAEWPCAAWRLAEAVETLTAEPETDKIADKLAATVGEPNRMLPFGRLPGYIAAIRDYRIETKVELREAKDAIDAALTRRMVSGG